MEWKGLRFTMKDGTFDWYDPVNIEDLIITDYWYKFEHTNGYTYKLLKSDVEKLEFYDLCGLCASEICEDGTCSNRGCKNS